jgi:hypothetical protein
MHHDDARKNSYWSRHRGDRLDDIFAPGFWSARLLWTQPTLREAAQDIANEFDVRIEID